MDLSGYRSKFPILSEYTYLNTARYCALPQEVSLAQKQFLDHVSTHGSWEFDQWSKLYEETRNKAAKLMGTVPDQVFFLPNVSLGYNFAAQYLPKRPVICLEGDFPSVTIAWEPHGYEVRYLDYKATDFNGQFEKVLTKADQIVSLSWIQSADGFEIDPDSLFRLCKKHNHTLVLDGTQGLGALPFKIDPEVSCIFLASGFKWLMAGYGVAVGYLSEDLIKRFKPMRGWNSIDFKSGIIEKGAKSLEVGNATYLNVAGLSKGLDLLNETGITEIAQHNQKLKKYLIDQLTNGGRKVKFPESRSSITSIQATEAEYDRLVEAKIQTSMQKDFIRISPHFYNTRQDIDRLLDVLY